MKHFVFYSLFAAFLLTFAIHPSFGELRSIDGEFYSNDQRLFESVLEDGKELQVKIQFFHNSDSVKLESVKVFIIDNPTKEEPDDYKQNIVEILYEDEIALDSISPTPFSLPFMPKQTGIFAYVISAEMQDRTKQAILHFATVEKFSKAFEEDNRCRNGLFSIIKPDFSMIGCVTEDTHKKLLQRGWNTSPENEI